MPVAVAVFFLRLRLANSVRNTDGTTAESLMTYTDVAPSPWYMQSRQGSSICTFGSTCSALYVEFLRVQGGR